MTCRPSGVMCESCGRFWKIVERGFRASPRMLEALRCLWATIMSCGNPVGLGTGQVPSPGQPSGRAFRQLPMVLCTLGRGRSRSWEETGIICAIRCDAQGQPSNHGDAPMRKCSGATTPASELPPNETRLRSCVEGDILGSRRIGIELLVSLLSLRGYCRVPREYSHRAPGRQSE